MLFRGKGERLERSWRSTKSRRTPPGPTTWRFFSFSPTRRESGLTNTNRLASLLARRKATHSSTSDHKFTCCDDMHALRAENERTNRRLSIWRAPASFHFQRIIGRPAALGCRRGGWVVKLRWSRTWNENKRCTS